MRVDYRLLPAPEKPGSSPSTGSYADAGADTTGLVSYGWAHSFAEIIGALTGAGLRVEHLHEFPTARRRRSGTGWSRTRRAGGGCPDGEGGRREDLPLSFSLRATRPAT